MSHIKVLYTVFNEYCGCNLLITTSTFGVRTPRRWRRRAEACERSETPHFYMCFYLLHSVVFIIKPQKRYSSLWRWFQNFRSRDSTYSNNMLKDIPSCSHYFINITAKTSWITAEWRGTKTGSMKRLMLCTNTILRHNFSCRPSGSFSVWLSFRLEFQGRKVKVCNSDQEQSTAYFAKLLIRSCWSSIQLPKNVAVISI